MTTINTTKNQNKNTKEALISKLINNNMVKYESNLKACFMCEAGGSGNGNGF